MPTDATLVGFALLLGLSLFFGLAFEEFHAQTGETRPGGIRTFPLLALSGGALYRLDPKGLLPLAAGLLVLGTWLGAYYFQRLREHAPDAPPDVEIVGPACNILAYLLGPVVFDEPHWVAVAITVAAVLLLTGREPLHGFARRVALDEIVTAGKFLILTGIVLPLLPDRPVIAVTPITPYQVWLALLAVCTLSYASYLLQRFVTPAGNDFATAVLGGLYSSTATTVVLARRAAAESASAPRMQLGIILATAVMYLRLLVIVAIFNRALAVRLAPSVLVLMLAGLAMAGLQYWRTRGEAVTGRSTLPRNPLELWAAALFAALFVLVSVVSGWAQAHYGTPGLDALAAVVGFTDIDPFVLSVAQNSAASLPLAAAAAAILIAASSNNILKAVYTVFFIGWRRSLPSGGALLLLAAGGVGAALLIAARG